MSLPELRVLLTLWFEQNNPLEEETVQNTLCFTLGQTRLSSIGALSVASVSRLDPNILSISGQIVDAPLKKEGRVSPSLSYCHRSVSGACKHADYTRGCSNFTKHLHTRKGVFPD